MRPFASVRDSSKGEYSTEARRQAIAAMDDRELELAHQDLLARVHRLRWRGTVTIPLVVPTTLTVFVLVYSTELVWIRHVSFWLGLDDAGGDWPRWHLGRDPRGMAHGHD